VKVELAKVNALRELQSASGEVGPLLSIPLSGTFGGHLPLKGKTPLWEFSASISFGQLIMDSIKASPLGEVGGVGLPGIRRPPE